jgi:glycosyltransferase involved in cell wall biosynthesis
MKVLIDDGLSTIQQLGGIGYQSLYLSNHLKKIIDCKITDYSKLRLFPRVIKRAAYIGLANIESIKNTYDLIHYQNYYIPRLSGKTKRVATVHDLGGLKCPEVYQEWYNIYFRRMLQNTIKRAEAVITVSNTIKEDILSYFPKIDKDRVFVCYNGIRSVFMDFHPTLEDIGLMNIDPYSYFLFVGNLEKRKNLPFLLSQFINAHNNSIIAPDTKLILVGKIGIGYEKFEHLLSEKQNIIHLGRLNDEQLVTLYKYCKAFIFPSIYEGFGIPIIEAMSQKVPILISNIPPSLELNSRHNNQCFIFDLDRKGTLIDTLSHLDKNHSKVAANLDYGDLSIYNYDNVAKEHVRVYNYILQMNYNIY